MKLGVEAEATTFPVWLIIVMGSLIAIGIFITVFGKKSKREQAQYTKKVYLKLYKLLSNFFLTQGRIANIKFRLESLSIYSKAEVEELTVKHFLNSLLMMVAVGGIGVILYKDFISISLVIVLGVIGSSIIIDKGIDTINYKIHRSLSRGISAIREEYLKLNSVAEAIASAKYEPIIAKPMEAIHTILTSSDSELRLREFFESTPFKPLTTLAVICYNINNSGDSKDEFGQSTFIQSMSLMYGDVQSELEKINKQKAEFGFIEYLPFLAVLGMPLLEGYFGGIMPGTSLIYNGLIGHIAKAVSLLAAIGSYTLIARINSHVSFKEDDRDMWVVDLLKRKSIRKLAADISPKGAKLEKINRRLHESISKVTVEQLYIKKLAYAILAFLLSLVAIMSIISMAKDYLYTSTQQLSLVATSEMDKYSQDSIIKLDTKYLEYATAVDSEMLTATVMKYIPSLTRKEAKVIVDVASGEKTADEVLGRSGNRSAYSANQGKSFSTKQEISITNFSNEDMVDIIKQLDPSVDFMASQELINTLNGVQTVKNAEAMKALVSSYMPGLTDLQVLDQIKRLEDKAKAVKGAYFQWPYMWACFLISIIAWFGPNMGLVLRKYLVETESENDFLQLQTLVSILMNMHIDTISALQQLYQHSRIHKEMLLYALHSYAANPEFELVNLQRKTPLIEFKRFIGKLALTINDLSLREAFNDLLMEREHMTKSRDLNIMTLIKRRRAICSPLSMLPIGCVVLGSLIIPLGTLGFMEFQNALTSFVAR